VFPPALLARWQKTYAVTRTAAGTFTQGRHAAGSTSTVSILAVIVPMSGRELERLPEGLRSSEVRAVFTVTPLIALDASHEPDQIAVDGAMWQVEIVNDWTASTGCYHCVVRKV
jgi:hypothetical protein